MTEITWLGHAAFLVSNESQAVLVDPFLTDNPVAARTADEVEPTVIVVTHGHSDHYGDAGEIARRTGAPIIASYELATHFGRAYGVEAIAANAGGTIVLGDVSLKLVPAVHSSSIVDGDRLLTGGAALGVVIRMDGAAVYHAGDTALFGDMSLIGDEGLDAALLPIGGTFTMDPLDAARASALLRSRIVIPMHFGTFPAIVQDPDIFVRAVGRTAEVKLLTPGESVHV